VAVADGTPWERQKGESTKAFEGFRTYRDLGAGRSLVAAAKALGKNKAVLSEWSMRHEWVRRVDAHDANEDRVRRAAHLAEVERMAARHATAAQATQEAVMAPVRAVLERLRADREKESTEFLDALTSGSPAAAMELALASAGRLPALQAAERLARGEPTEIIRSASEVVEARSVEDLAKTVEALAVAGVLSLPLPDLEVIESQEVETA